MKRLVLFTLLTCSLVSARAGISQYEATLSGPAESPPNGSPGTGSAVVIYNSTLHTLTVDVVFQGLNGTTTASHIHAPTPSPFTSTAGVATTTPYFTGFPIGVTSGSYSNVLDLTQSASWNSSYITANGGTPATAETALAFSMFTGQAYLNIHTTTFAGGEIRGFLVAIPEPSTLALVGLGGGALALSRWSKRRIR